jgi:hypothetical protein
MSVGKLARVAAVAAACAAAAGSATSSSNSSSSQSGSLAGQSSAPPPQQMEANVALGLWRSTFGGVKIEADNSHGGLASGNLQGIWVYQRQGQEVIGYFSGNLRGNVLSFRWQEPNNPPLTGEGFLVFDVQGRQYSGRWWSDKRDRVGDWSGWRQPLARGDRTRNEASGAYGGQDYGYEPAYRRPQPYQPRPNQQPYQQQPYQQPPYQQQPYQQQPYQQSPYQQQPYQQPPYQQPYQQPYPPQRQPPPQQPPSQPTYY